MHIVAFHRAQGLAVTDAGQACVVSVWIDAEGQEIDDPADAVAAVVPLPDDRWEAVDLRDFDSVEMH